jgi:hypothetical protein
MQVTRIEGEIGAVKDLMNSDRREKKKSINAGCIAANQKEE